LSTINVLLSPWTESVRLCYDGWERQKVTVDGSDEITQAFEAHRAHLRAVAYRMLGSLSEAEDAVQETWLRLARSDTSEVGNLGGWLTTVVARVCLDLLRARTRRREDPLEVHLPDPIVTAPGAGDPQDQALLADSVGLALLVVLDTLSPNERLAFVLHDVFAVPFEQIAAVLGKSPAAAKQLASRARRRLRGAPSAFDGVAVDPRRRQEIIDAFLAASRDGDFDALVAVLDPDVVLRAEAGSGPFAPSRVLRGAPAVAGQALQYASLARFARRVDVNGAPGFLVAPDGRPIALLSLSIGPDSITAIDVLADPDRLARLDLPVEGHDAVSDSPSSP
jgi:RNA polymerase sigma-70 factor (ECF subfamily)